VIGPAINLVSRIEAIAKSRDLPLVLTGISQTPMAGTLASLGQADS
jgi:adenylate cyclase